MPQPVSKPHPMFKHVAFCDDSILYLNNRAVDKLAAQKYPGLSFLPVLAKRLKADKISIVTGDIALTKFARGEWKPQETALIQVAGSRLGDYLLNLGVIPVIVFSGESPLWIPETYLRFNHETHMYQFRFFFRHAYHRTAARPETDFALHFPSFSARDKQLAQIPLSKKKKKVVAVLANKYYATKHKQSLKRSIIEAIKLASRPLYFLQKRLFPGTTGIWGRQDFYFSELHTQRLALLDYFSKMGFLDLFGHGWHDISNLPPKRISNLRKYLPNLYHGSVRDKIKTLRNYSFCLCLENMSYPSYVTEKIFDCLKAGTVPIYLGAPDIEEYVPVECFIHVSRFKSPQALFEYINNISDDEYETYVAAGQKFITSSKGLSFTYEHLADQFYEAIRKSCFQDTLSASSAISPSH